MVESPFTDDEVGLLYRHGTQGFIYHAVRTAQKQAIEEWKADEKKREALREFNEWFDMDRIVLDTSLGIERAAPLQPGLDGNEQLFQAISDSPFPAPGMAMKRIGDELAQDVAKHFEQELVRLLEQSTFSKQQFIVFVLLWKDPKKHGTGRYLGERGVAEALELAIGTVRSHHARAREKLEKARFTAGLTKYADADLDSAAEDTKTLLDEKLAE